jgi:hypothetical protein
MDKDSASVTGKDEVRCAGKRPVMQPKSKPCGVEHPANC